MADTDSKGPGWIVELLPRGGDPNAAPRRFLDLQFSEDLHTLEVQRAGPDGKAATFELNVDSPADVTRLFAAEVIGLIATQANRNFQSQNLGTVMSAPVIFNDEGHVISEIYQAGKLYRRAVFDPVTLKLFVTGSKSESLLSITLKESSALPIDLAKALGVKLPLAGIQ